MEFRMTCSDRHEDIVDLFCSTFTTSEGAAEGALVGGLVQDLLAKVAAPDIHVFCAVDGDRLVGAAIFSRVTYRDDDRSVFILSPMAVATDLQGKGIGQKLLTFGLQELRRNGAAVALTYGDIAFYAKTGFRQISVAVAAPPLPLTYPEGWLGQSLTGGPLVPLKGPSTCVPPLGNPALW